MLITSYHDTYILNYVNIMSTYVQVWVGLFHAVFKQGPRHNEKRGAPYLLRKIIGGGGGSG